MSDREQMESLAAAALQAAADASETEVLVSREDEGVTRFADSQVHQSVARHVCNVTVRAVLGDGRAGVASIGSEQPDDAALVSQRAIALARLAPADPGFAGVAAPSQAASPWCDPATAAATPGDRADVVRAVVAGARGVAAAGSVRTALLERCVATSQGASLYSSSTRAYLNLVLTGPSSSGHAEEGSHAIGELAPVSTAARAADKVEAGTDPFVVEAGDWPVVLEPSAVTSLVLYLGYLGFNAKAVAEQRAFTSGRMGAALFDPKLTVVDDALDPQARGFPFDPEATPKQRVEMIADGRLAGLVHDRRSAAAAGTSSTGHALPPPNPLGPVPLDSFIVPGDGGSVDDLVAGMQRGLLVTRFHYVNILHEKKAVLTGMTRDGTFLIEGGKVVRPVRNLRFTQSIVDALAQVDAIGSQTGFGLEIFGEGARQPALALPRFHFTGLTDFG